MDHDGSCCFPYSSSVELLLTQLASFFGAVPPPGNIGILLVGGVGQATGIKRDVCFRDGNVGRSCSWVELPGLVPRRRRPVLLPVVDAVR